MALKEFTFSIGETTQTVKLPEEHISDVMEGKHVPAVDVKRYSPVIKSAWSSPTLRARGIIPTNFSSTSSMN